jgi:hypothetical protein
MASRGLSGLLRNKGRMQMICSVELEEDEREVFEAPKEQLKLLNRKAIQVAEMLAEPFDELEKNRLSLFSIMRRLESLVMQMVTK